MRKIITIVFFFVIGFAGIGGGIGIGFMLTYPSLEHANENMDYWHNEYNDLYEEYNNLTQDYNDLLADYNSLLSDYNSLFGQYQSILSVLEDPLTSYVIPTLSQVQTWLYYDDTDSFSYTNNVWMCGDFSAMLMTRAKEIFNFKYYLLNFSPIACMNVPNLTISSLYVRSNAAIFLIAPFLKASCHIETISISVI